MKSIMNLFVLVLPLLYSAIVIIIELKILDGKKKRIGIIVPIITLIISVLIVGIKAQSGLIQIRSIKHFIKFLVDYNGVTISALTILVYNALKEHKHN